MWVSFLVLGLKNLVISSNSCEQLSKDAVSAPTSQASTPIPAAVKAAPTPAVNYISLASFSWDQDNDKVKVRN